MDYRLEHNSPIITIIPTAAYIFKSVTGNALPWVRVCPY